MAWLADQTLLRSGNAIRITIPRAFLHQLGWIAGGKVMLELDDTLEQLVVRLPRASDYGPTQNPRVHLNPADRPTSR